MMKTTAHGQWNLNQTRNSDLKFDEMVGLGLINYFK
jgi:hypothetical protein